MQQLQFTVLNLLCRAMKPWSHQFLTISAVYQYTMKEIILEYMGSQMACTLFFEETCIFEAILFVTLSASPGLGPLWRWRWRGNPHPEIRAANRLFCPIGHVIRSREYLFSPPRVVGNLALSATKDSQSTLLRTSQKKAAFFTFCRSPLLNSYLATFFLCSACPWAGVVVL